jgi:hypothetical protein
VKVGRALRCWNGDRPEAKNLHDPRRRPMTKSQIAGFAVFILHGHIRSTSTTQSASVP